MHIKDLDVENRRSWQGALDMIFTLCGENSSFRNC